jgi:hypothetical protein
VKSQREEIIVERRSLLEGLKTDSSVDRLVEDTFVYGEKPKPSQLTQPPGPTAISQVREERRPTGSSVSRLPLTTRVRADYAAALKRASLERQLNSVFPNTLQDILEEALAPWLRSNGYLN